MDRADLPSLFRISPIGTVENGHIRLQKGKIVSIENEKAKIELLERGFPGMLARHGPHASINNAGREAAAVLPALCSWSDAVRAVDQLQARLWHINPQI
jgi:hypothetical protein